MVPATARKWYQQLRGNGTPTYMYLYIPISILYVMPVDMWITRIILIGKNFVFEF